MGMFLVMAVTSCGGETGAKAVYDKIEKQETLTPEDYNVILDYGTDCLNAVSEAIEKGDEAKLEKIEDEYPYFETFMNQLQHAKEGDLDKQKVAEFFNKAFTVAMKAQSMGVDLDM